jgi:ribonuclease T
MPLKQPPYYISVDIETAGPAPGEYALLTLGACTLDEPPQTFYIELQPDRDGMTAEAFAIHKLSLQTLRTSGSDPRSAMEGFENWVAAVTPAGNRPVLVAFNAPFDWMFIAEYFQRYVGRNPFGHSALDVKALYMGLYRTSWANTSYEDVCRALRVHQPLAHNALEDALDQANLFRILMERLPQAELSSL